MDSLDNHYMARALRLAERGQFTTSPNPRVGCILVKEGEEIASGWHQVAGGPHAEILALEQAGDKAKGATCYVSLEPCSHIGRTGPCSQALIEAGVSRVVYGMEDPNPKVQGEGVEKLRAAGIEVEGPLMAKEAAQINAGYVKRMTTGRPLVRLKMAMSLDARTAMPDGNAFWITGPKARADVQKLRARSCAVLSGWKSVALDKSQMTVRPEEFDLDVEYLGQRQPLRILLDAKLQMPSDARFFKAESPILVANLSREGTGDLSHVRYLKVAENNEHIDLEALLDQLGAEQINDLLIESGATLAGAFMRAGLVDELIIYVAPKLMGSEARALFDIPLQKMAESLPLHIQEIRQLGGDIRITAKLEKE